MRVDYAKNHPKLGPVYRVSRPVGLSCPPSCPLLGHGCYAERGERRGRNTMAHRENMSVTAEDFARLSARMLEKRRFTRLCQSGGWCRDGRPDMQWIRAIADGVAAQGYWSYTHSYDRSIAELHGTISILASVHTPADADAAFSAGFRRLAIVLPTTAYRAVTGQLVGLRDGHRLDWHGVKALPCRHQIQAARIRHKRRYKPPITCSTCRYCVNPRQGHVILFRH